MKIVKKAFRITGITIAGILLLLFLLPLLFPGFVADKIKQWTNNAITTELNFSKARLSFFNHFPSLTLTLHDVSLMGSAPYAKDTLLKSRELAFGIDLSTLFSDKISIDEIYLTQANIFIKVDEHGAANYNIYKTDSAANTAADSSGTSLKIERIQVDNSNLAYDDLSIPMLITAQDLNYVGKGDLSKAIFDLSSKLEIKVFDFDYNFGHYINSKSLRADLVTKINTNSLAFEFTKNDLLLNALPVDFIGKFEFLQQGYNMNFELHSRKGNLHDVFSALPPAYMGWLDQTKADGQTNIEAYLTGQYIAEQNIMPGLGFKMTIRDGFISHQNVASPVSNLFLNFDSKLPSLNPDSLYVNIDSIFFNIDKDYLSAVIKLNNLYKPTVHAKINAALDLEKLDKAFGLQPFDIKGTYNLSFTADGSYQSKTIQAGVRKQQTVITGIPSFTLQSSLKDGYFKHAALPEAIKNISFSLNANCSDEDYHHINLSLEQLNAAMLSDYVKGYFKLNSLTHIDTDLKALLHLQNVRQYYPLDSMDLRGNLYADIVSKGIYDPSKKSFPVTSASIKLQDGLLKTKYYPNAIEQINVVADAVNRAGTLADMQFTIQPVAFLFEGQPFTLKADLSNLDDLRYNIASKGTLDVGKIYRVFAQDGLAVTGLLTTDFVLQGLQSDAANGRYNKLHNTGTAAVKDIRLQSDYFPQPFIINNGRFHFNQDKILFDQFNANYGSTNVELNGYLSNYINYALQNNAPLTGNFSLFTDHFLVNEFMAYAAPAGKDSTAPATDSTGVVMIPKELDITVNANARQISYDSLSINNFKGGVSLHQGTLTLNKTTFNIIGTSVEMNAAYESITPRKAGFNYHIKADSFDVKRAYKEVKLFRDLASSAANTQGIISLDYTLSGKLNADMKPIYPSLKGSGVLSLENVKVNGLRLFSAVSKATGRDSVNNPNLKKVQIKTTINNNIITLQRTRMKVFGFRPRFEGQVSFNGQLNLTGRLGLPPFGIFGIPFTVVGTQENPQVKLRRAKESDTIAETTEEADTEE
ncbi:AsmA family protein [Panacibacter sp. DH6]|uniref:AsmA family protein n=1 Tax=Panacibacter microcysteis TaxID=2793269 RepID=A0A931GVR0_9BACT|nr:AsmA family protein [Panacibacter microcysteis]MBG9375358.1 AsmA family protein [Panacibacter microcysteis]